jgi:hypothetical protein
MILVLPVAEPEGFDQACRSRGKTWLAEHEVTLRPRDYWSPFREQLAKGFADRCGYLGMYITSGHIDHHRPIKTHRELAYEWSNYRYVDSCINQCKGSLGDELLDPYEVEEGWFEIELPSLQMRATERVPEAMKDRAAFTLRRLQLRDGEAALRYRRMWLEIYERGGVDLKTLDQIFPLLSEALRRRETAPLTPRA